MPDRTDIDALLIGSLYGELTAADEARLTAHLESHPADRTALADLTHTRAAVRDSRLLAFQFEPPQAISALLLQEASRRAPRQDRETASWFQRFTRSFMAHPAMAAAAMLVLVVSVAGTFYLRGDDQLAAPRPPATRESHMETASTDQVPAPAAAAQVGPELATQPGANPPAAPQEDDHKATGSEGYRVGLREVPRERTAASRPGVASEGDPQDVDKAERLDGKDPRPEPPAVQPEKAAKRAKKPAAIEVRQTPGLMPKDLQDGEISNFKHDTAASGDRDAAAAGETRSTRRASGAISALKGGAPSPSPSSAPPSTTNEPAQRVAPAAPPASVPRGSANDAKKASAKSVPVSPRMEGAPPPPQAAVTVAPNADPYAGDNRSLDKLGPSEAKPAKSEEAADVPSGGALLAWARKRHDQVIALVGSSNCRAAASAAGEIYNRAPGYYAANIVTDRSIRPCLAYLNSERDRQDRSRAAAKRAIRADDAANAPADSRK